jgi:UDP-glucose 4-epimerase
MYHRNNVTGTKNIMHVMKKYHCNNIIFASSAAVYGDVSKIPINESDPLKPCNPYGLSKMKDEHIIQNANIKYFIFRLFNVSGASDSHLHGIDNENPQSLIAAVNKKIMNNQTPVIYGDKYKTNDGTCFRDYIHVEDVVNAFMNIIKHIDTLPSGIFNLGSGQGYTVLDIIKLACELHGVPLSYEIKNNRGGDPSNLLADISLSKNILD